VGHRRTPRQHQSAADGPVPEGHYFSFGHVGVDAVVFNIPLQDPKKENGFIESLDKHVTPRSLGGSIDLKGGCFAARQEFDMNRAHKPMPCLWGIAG
jgi:hypothetical protein